MHVLYPGDENEKCTRSVDMTSDVKGWEQLFLRLLHVLSFVYRKSRSQE